MANQSKSRTFLYVALGLLLGGVGFGYYMWNKPHMDMSAAEAAVTVSAGDLIKAFQADEKAANTTYVGKIVAVSGTVTEFTKSDSSAYVILDTGDMMAAIKCNMDPLSDEGKNAVFTVGQAIKVKGECSGYLSDVILERCVPTK